MNSKFLSSLAEVETLVDLGFFVLPCIRNSKKPILPDGVNGATRSLQLIDRWGTCYTDCNWAVATGRSGLLVIDVDKHGADGAASLEEAQKELGALPLTLRVSTPSGGLHYYFKAPDNVKDCRASVGLLQGVDVRCNNTYVLAPPSRIKDVGKYQFSGATMELADLPERWADFLQRRSNRTRYDVSEQKILTQIGFHALGTDKQNAIVRRCEKYVAEMPIAISGQNGHRAALEVANVIFWGFALPPDLGYPIFFNWSSRCQPPWTEAELRHKMKTALDGLQGKPKGWILDENTRSSITSKKDVAFFGSQPNDRPEILQEKNDSPRPNIRYSERPSQLSVSRFGQPEEPKPFKLTFGDNPFGAITAQEFSRLDLKDNDFLLSPWLRSGDTVILYGPAGTFKSFLLLCLAVAVASGSGLLKTEGGYKWTADKAKNVLYIDGEMRPETVRQRLAGFTDKKTRLENLYYSNAILQDFDLDLSSYAAQRTVIQYAQHVSAGLVIVDNLSCLYKCDDANRRESWEPLNQFIKDCRRAGLTLVLADHTGKTGNGARGSSGKIDMPELAVELSRCRLPDRVKLRFTKGRQLSGKDFDPITLFFNGSNFEVVDRRRSTDPLETDSAKKRRLVVDALKQGKPPKEIIASGLGSKNFVYGIRRALFSGLPFTEN